ncbi:MAG TPA: MmgE/PrpD family protein [Phycisphaerae bacterium]|nr:MmgE/PrpD family protein [Phycisphaerae bacterium]
MATITGTLSKWACGLRYKDLPPEAVEAAKRFLYDSVGCALGGYGHEDCQILLRCLEEFGGQPQCTLIGSGLRSSVVNAALYNALAIRAMDYNDIYWKADPCHPSDLIPAATGICEWKGLPGKDLIVGIVLAYEMEMRLCEAADPGIRERGWHHATLTAFAAPMVASRMLGLSAGQMQNAIGIAGSHCCTLGAVTAGKLTMMKNTVDPMATQAGVRAALLAAAGYTGPEHVLDGKEGLVHCLGPGWHLERLTDGLGKRFKITDCGMKAFPIEALTHSPLTATLSLVQEHDIQPQDVAQITVETIARAADILSDPAKYRPTTRETADHSMPYCLAVAIADREVTPRQFMPERITDESLHPLMDAVKAVANEEFESLFPESQPARVTIVTHDGRSFSARVDVPKGEARDPMTVEEIKAKFESLIPGAYSSEQRSWIQDGIMSLEEVENVGDLMALLVPEEERRRIAVDEVHVAVQSDEAQRVEFEAAVEKEVKARVRAAGAKTGWAKPAAKDAAPKKAKKKVAKAEKAKAKKRVAKTKKEVKGRKKVTKAKRKVAKGKKKAARAKNKPAKAKKAKKAKKRPAKKAVKAKRSTAKGRKKEAARTKKVKRSRRR